ncbi:TATA box-binding protein-like 1 isoform X2 [Rattus norvegicus]|uniref:TATA box-binding protein-like 1 isoform X2 n=1 Tax=Rattus norvegicus TaxID=10116 RepID=UPI0019178374|nr:TATA box-binding protein-like 1 isoform X1 [Rattus norvegicus]
METGERTRFIFILVLQLLLRVRRNQQQRCRRVLYDRPVFPRTRCHLNLRKIALEGANVIYKRDVGKVLMKLRKPRITATIWSSGKIICTGATSEEEAKFGARRLARSLQKLGFQVIFTDFKVVNVLAVCNMPFEIRLPEFTKNNRPHASYEPELHPAVCYRIKSLRATLQIFSTGSITVTGNLDLMHTCSELHHSLLMDAALSCVGSRSSSSGPNVKAVATAVEQIYPFVFESRKEIL